MMPLDPARLDDPHAVRDRVAAWVRRHGQPSAGARVVVACSGGPDSLALLLALAPLPLSPVAVYVDHGLRAGTEAEAALVARVAAGLGLESRAVRVAVAPAGNRMAAAREARYRALLEQARGVGAAWIAVGHTVTDQAETVELRRRRGDRPGDHALAGMPLDRPLGDGVTLLRPLLGAGVTREETAALVRAAGLEPALDPTNLDERYQRTRVRRELLAAGPEATRALLRASERAATRLADDDAQARALGDLTDLDAARVATARLEVVLRLLRQAGAHRASLEQAARVQRLAACHHGSQRLAIGSGVWAQRRYRRLSLGPEPPPPRPVELLVPGPGRYAFLDRSIELVRLPPDAPAPSLATASRPARRAGATSGLRLEQLDILDETRLAWPLALRTLRPGDRLRLSAGGRKLHDVLIDRKVPRDRRHRLALLAPAGPDSSQVLWAESVGPCRSVGAIPLPAPGSAAPRIAVMVYSPTEDEDTSPTLGG